ncbi:hypothetical protein ACWDFL_03345 [Streptomyces bungoensis]
MTSPSTDASARLTPRRRPVRHIPWPALIAAAYAVVRLVVVVPHLGLGWDETVYVSQVDPRHPAAFFSAPRSRGISFLASPVLAATDSTTVLRVVLALSSAGALYAAYRVWQPLLGPGRTALAVLLFGGLWTSLLYGPQAMPNLWVALTAVAAAGCASANVGGNNRSTTARALLRQAAREPAAALTRTRSGPPRYARTWTRHPLPGTGLTAYLPVRTSP